MSKTQASAQKIVNICVNLLALYPKTEFEIAKKIDAYLAKPDFDDLSLEEKAEVKEIAIEWLKETGLIDDVEYFASFLRGNNSSNKPDGFLLIVKKMRQRGIPDEILSQKTAEIEDYDKINAVKLLQKKYGMSHIPQDLPMSQKQKMGAYLASRGFKYASFPSVDADM